MNAEAEPSALRRKTGATQSSVEPSAMDVAKAVRVAMARAGDKALDVPVSVKRMAMDYVLPEGLASEKADVSLLIRLKDDLGGVGLAIVEPQVIAAIIEATTLGAVLESEAEERAPTGTDAVLAGPFLDTFFVKLGELLDELQLPPPIDGFMCGDAFEDLRAAKMGLLDDSHRRYTITLDFGLGAKSGGLTLVLPARRPHVEVEIDEPDHWGDALETAVLGTRAHIEAELCRIRLPLKRVEDLQVGELLPLGEATLDGVSLIGPTGERVAGARLGKAGVARAVRVSMVPMEAAAPQMDGGLGDIGSAPMASDPGLALPVPDVGIDPAPLPEPGGIEIDLPANDLPALDAAPMTDLGDFGSVEDELGLSGEPMAIDIDPIDDNALGAIEPMQVPEIEV